MTIKNFVWNNIFKTSQKQENKVVITKKIGEAVLNRFVSEEDIRLEAYYLWEKSGGPVGEDFWSQAEEKIRSRMEESPVNG